MVEVWIAVICMMLIVLVAGYAVGWYIANKDAQRYRIIRNMPAIMCEDAATRKWLMDRPYGITEFDSEIDKLSKVGKL